MSSSSLAPSSSQAGRRNNGHRECAVNIRATILIGTTFGLMLSPGVAFAADTGQLPCKTTAECNEQAAKIGATAPTSTTAHTSATDAREDQFYWVNKINKASTVMLVETGIFPKDVGQLIAKGVDYAIRQAAQPGGKRPADVLQIERIMTDHVGAEAS